MSWGGAALLYLIAVGSLAHVPLLWWGYCRALGWLLELRVRA